MEVTLQLFPWFELAVIPLQNLPFLASSARAFSLLRQDFPPALPLDCPQDSWPASHIVAFQNQHCHTYFSPSLV